MTDFKSVLSAIDAWTLHGLVKATDKRGKALLEIDGQQQLYPYWLAVRKVNQLGAERGL